MTPQGHTPIKAVDVPAYVAKRYGLEISRQTVYNWMLKGRNNEKLRYEDASHAGSRFIFIRFTSREWVDQFVAASGVAGNSEAAGVPDPG